MRDAMMGKGIEVGRQKRERERKWGRCIYREKTRDKEGNI